MSKSSFFAIVLFLSACGGGGGGGGGSLVTESMPDAPTQAQLRPRPSFQLLSFYHGLRTDKEKLVSFLRDVNEGAAIIRHQVAPTIRFAASTNGVERNHVTTVVDQYINPKLPPDFRISIGSDVPDRSTASVPNGEIWIDFVSPDDFPSGIMLHGIMWHAFSRDVETPAFSSHIWFPEYLFTTPTFGGIYYARDVAVAQDILHAMGFVGHPEFRRHSVAVESMAPGMFIDLMHRNDLLFPLDKDGLAALYMLQTGDDPENLGPWNKYVAGVMGSIQGFAFAQGVRGRGLTFQVFLEPWGPETEVAGRRSKGDIRDSITGNATWTGDLIGYTPQLRYVHGHAAMELNLATLNGHLEFNNLESRTFLDNFDLHGPSDRWGDGDLSYKIAVKHNAIIRTGGDAGEIDASFYGFRHEGIAGTLERDDLTAAFGAAR